METYVYLIHLVLNLILSIFALCFSIRILSQKLLFTNASTISPMMTLYFVYIFITSFVSTLNYIYLIFTWRPQENLHDARILFVSGLFCSMMIFIHPVVEIFLCIDRCLTIIFLIKYAFKLKTALSSFAMIFLIFFGSLILTQSLYFNGFPKTGLTTCRFYYCLGYLIPAQYTMFSRVILASLNLCCCAILIIVIKIFITFSSPLVVRKVNKTVIIVILATTIIDFTPNLIGQLFQNLSGESLLNIIGPYTVTTATGSITFCGGIYCYTLKKTLKLNNVSGIIKVSNFR